MKKTKGKFHCYGDDILFSEKTCFKNECKWYVPCKILCGYEIKMFRYILAGVCFGIGLNFTETVGVLRANYDITENAAKLSILRFYKKQKEVIISDNKNNAEWRSKD